MLSTYLGTRAYSFVIMEGPIRVVGSLESSMDPVLLEFQGRIECNTAELAGLSLGKLGISPDGVS